MTTASIPSLRSRVQDLVAYVVQGRILEAFEEFYADDVVMQENTAPPTVGKAANRDREKEFVASVAQVHEVDARSIIVDGNQAAIYWVFDYTGKNGVRVRMDQIAHQTWRDGRIVAERFFYDTASLVQ